MRDFLHLQGAIYEFSHRFETTVPFLEKHQIPYMLAGALGVVYYGRPRASHDIDFVVEIHRSDLKRVLNAFKNI